MRTLHRLRAFLWLALVLFGAVARGQDFDLGIVQTLGDAADRGQWLLLGACALVIVVFAVRAVGVRLWAPLGGDRAGAILGFLSGALAVIVSGLAAGKPLTYGLVCAGFVAGASAIGLFTGGKRIVAPKDGLPETAGGGEK